MRIVVVVHLEVRLSGTRHQQSVGEQHEVRRSRSRRRTRSGAWDASDGVNGERARGADDRARPPCIRINSETGREFEEGRAR